MKPLYFSKKDANDLLNTLGYCWLKCDTDLMYLAVVRCNKLQSCDNYLIEMGSQKKVSDDTMVIETDFMISLFDIPMSCPLDSQNDEYSWDKCDFLTKANKDTSLTRETKYVGNIKPLSLSELKIRPLIAGISINGTHSPEKIGTIGAFFTLNIPLFENDIFFITNYHNLFSENYNLFTDYYKENELLDYDVSNLIFQPNNKSFNYKNLVGYYSGGQYHNNKNKYDKTLDYAIVQLNIHAIESNVVEVPNDDIDFNDHKLYKLNSISSGLIDKNTEMSKTPVISGIQEPTIGMRIRFHGSTTVISDTTEIRSINAMVKIENAFNSDEKLIFKNQLLFDNISTSGDSGSVIINDNNKIVGLLHAGDSNKVSIASNINDIFCDKNHDCSKHENCINKLKLKSILT